MSGDDDLQGGTRKDGGQGIDLLVGGAGDDEYLVDTSEDVIVEVVGENSDSVHASSEYTLPATSRD